MTCCSASGSPRRCRTRSWRPTSSPGPGSTATPLRITNPLVADESVLRTSLRPGLLRAVAFNESHRRPRVVAVRDRPRLPARSGRAARRVRGARRRARRRGGAGGRRRVAGARRGDGRRRARRPATVPPGLHPTRSATLVAGRDVIGAVGEVAPEVLDAFGIADRVAVRRARPAAGARRRAEAGAVAADEPAPVERPRPRLRPPRRRAGREAGQGDPPRCRRRCSSTSTCSTCTAGRRHRRGRRSLAYRLRLQAPDRNLTDADVAERAPAGRPRRRPSSAPSCAADGGRRGGGPGWPWVVVPMALSALIVGGIAVAVRGGGER